MVGHVVRYVHNCWCSKHLSTHTNITGGIWVSIHLSQSCVGSIEQLYEFSIYISTKFELKWLKIGLLYVIFFFYSFFFCITNAIGWATAGRHGCHFVAIAPTTHWWIRDSNVFSLHARHELRCIDLMWGPWQMAAWHHSPWQLIRIWNARYLHAARAIPASMPCQFSAASIDRFRVYRRITFTSFSPSAKPSPFVSLIIFVFVWCECCFVVNSLLPRRFT